MSKSASINWREVAVNLDHAPEGLLQTASKLWRNKLGEKRRDQPQKSEKDIRGDNIQKDAEQQALWKEEYNSATEELLYFGKFVDKNEHIRLLQRVKVVKRTEKQIHIVAAYTLYFTMMKHGSEAIVWSAKPDGDLFGNFYTDWKPVVRYRLRRISKTRLFKPSILDIPQGDDKNQDNFTRAWKDLCGTSLFSDEREYAEWHLVRYENAAAAAETPNKSAYCSCCRDHPASYALLGLSISATQAEIKVAYKRMAMKHHPDRGGKVTEFHKVKAAYDALNGKRGVMRTR